LQQWVERRMPKELVLGTDRAGMVVLAPLVSSARDDREGQNGNAINQYLDSLPAGDFLPEEDHLRDCIIQVLERSDGHLGATTFMMVMRDPRVKAARNFLPSFLGLEDWIERRIGGEVRVFSDAKHQGRIMCKFAGPSPEEKENLLERFLEDLPQDRHTAEEQNLRTALYAFLATVPPGHVALLNQAGANREVRQAKHALLPKLISLKAWIERRIGSEIELQETTSGQFQMIVTEAGGDNLRKSSLKPAAGKAKGKGGTPVVEKGKGGPPAGKAQGKGSKSEPGQGKGKAKAKDQGKDMEPMDEWQTQKLLEHEEREKTKDDFFASLPEDSLTPEELDLRDALVDFLSSKQDGLVPSLSDAGGDPGIKRARPACLPRGVSLRAWIDNRIGGEIETVDQEESKEVFFGYRGHIDPAALEAAVQRQLKRAAAREAGAPPRSQERPPKRKKGKGGGAVPSGP